MSRTKTWVLRGLAAFMIGIGALHFANPEPFAKIVPSFLPSPVLLVYVSGFFEVLGGIGLLVPRVRRAAAWGLVALYVAVFPANVNMAVHHIAFDDAHPIPGWALWGRLPLQIVFLALAYWFTRPEREASGALRPARAPSERDASSRA